MIIVFQVCTIVEILNNVALSKKPRVNYYVTLSDLSEVVQLGVALSQLIYSYPKD